MNVRELAKLRADALRPLLEDEGLTYRVAAHRLGMSIGSVAGLADRFKIKTASPFSSPTKEGIRYVTTPKTPKPKKPHQGFVKFVGAGEPTDAAPVKASAWDPIPGSMPVALEHRTGCAWPCDGPGGKTLFCDLPVQEGKSWCAHHYAMGARVVAVGTAVRRGGKPDRYSL